MALRDFLQRRMEKAKLLKDAQEQARISKVVEERMKSPNERELESFQEKERQKLIKAKLQQFQQREQREMFSGGLTPDKNIFKGHKNILGGKKIFNMGKKISGGNMFFK